MAKHDLKTELTKGAVYAGVVESVDLVTRTIGVNAGGVVLPNCVYASAALSSFFGMAEAGLPSVGANVLVVYMGNDMSVVISTLTAAVEGQAAFRRHSIAGIPEELHVANEEAFKKEKRTTKSTAYTYPISMDALPGESERLVGTGPALRLLYNFAQLSASDAAKIEAHIFNDMVRICDNYFVHHMCGGDELVWSAGKNTKEFHFTGWPHEAEGKLEEHEQLASETVGEYIYEPGKAVEHPYSDTGRWRLSEYYGFLGDMIHRWVTTPTEVISNIMDNSFRAGQYRSWIGSDGTLSIQAAGGVQVEVTQHIVIPAILKSWNQPDFDMEKALSDLDAELLKVWGSGPDWEDLRVACWQLQYYSRYISTWHALARMRQLEKKEYCKIPTEKDAPKRTATAGEPDKESATPEAATAMKGHAIMSMDPAGSVALISNGTTSVILNQGNIQLACPGNIELKAGGTLFMQARDISIQAVNRFEIVSLFGELIAKARTSLRMLCEAGTLWLKGDAQKDKKAVMDGYEGTDVPVEDDNTEYAVVLDASEGKTLVHGAEGVVVAASGEKSKVNLQATASEGSVNITAQDGINLWTMKDICLKASNLLCRALNVGFDSMLVKLGASTLIKEGMLHARMIKSEITAAVGTFIGQQMFVSKLNKPEIDEFAPDLKADDVDKPLQEMARKQMHELEEDYIQNAFAGESFRMADWYPDSEAGSVTSSASLKASPFESVVLAEEDPKKNYFTLGSGSVSLMPARRTDSGTQPYPGKGAVWFHCPYDKKKALNVAWEQSFSESDIKTSADMQVGAYTYCFTKLTIDPYEEY